MFNQQELQILIGGVEDPVDVDNLMRNCVYGGVYDESHATIQRFWKVRGRVDDISLALLNDKPGF
jgi:ubiquitin-protein ligase E3 C